MLPILSYMYVGLIIENFKRNDILIKEIYLAVNKSIFFLSIKSKNNGKNPYVLLATPCVYFDEIMYI